MLTMRLFGVASALALAACSGSSTNDATKGTETAAQTTAPAETPAPAEPAAATPAATPPAAPVDFASLTGDAAKGETVFNQCKACHSIEAGKNLVGPSLAGVVGRKSGQVPGFAYSDAYKNGTKTWTPETIFAYLDNPMAMMPGSKMTFRLNDPQKRADVIAYLKTKN